MTCEGCKAAAQNARTGMYGAGCAECEARALASGPFAHAAYVRGDPAELRRAMLLAWPDAEKYRVGRAAVHRHYLRIHGEKV